MPEQYTVVQHSAAGYKDDPQFARGLETRSITTKKEAAAIARAGGVLLPTYGAAEDYAMKEMYPEGYMGLIAAAPGGFATLEVDGLRVYVPKAEAQ